MLKFMSLLQAHGGWGTIQPIFDDTVYKKMQLFRVAFATKSPEYDYKLDRFLLDKIQNILLPVDATGGNLLRPVLTRGHYLHVDCDTWMSYLVTTSHAGRQVKGFDSTSSFLVKIALCNHTYYTACDGAVVLFA
jgi:hypothetical protein